MRFIRTGRTMPLPVSSGNHVGKGWVREGILSGLATEPSTLTEVSRRLGVSKSTASYHLSLLMERGAIEVVDSWVGRGGVQVKRYGLKEGSLVTLLTRGEENAELGKLRETFDLQALAWESSNTGITLNEVQVLLYKMFLHLFKISRSEHRALMREYGNRMGMALAKQVPRQTLNQGLRSLTKYLSSSGMSDFDLLEIPNSAVLVVVSNTCIGSTEHQTNSCHYLEGIIEGAARSMFGPGIKVGRVADSGLPSCLIAIGRVKKLDLSRLRDAVLMTPHYSSASHRQVGSRA